MNIKQFKHIIIILIMNTAVATPGLPFIFDHLDKDDGLSNNSVSSIQQDSRGFLWFGTQNGLNYYDGYEFYQFHNNPFDDNTIAHELIQTLFIDDEDIIWVGTYNGVSKLEMPEKKITNYNVLNNLVITSMDKDMDGNLWIATLGGLNKLNIDTGELVQYLHNEDKPDSLMNNVIRSVLVDSQNRIWIGNLSGIDLYNPETDSFIHYPYDKNIKENGLPSPYVMSIVEQREDILFIGTWNGGVTRFNVKTGSFKNYETPDKRIYTLRFDKQGLLWAGSWGGGISIIEPGSGFVEQLTSSENSKTSISSDTIYSFFEDRDGIFWVGTNGGGISKLNHLKQDFNFLTHNNGEDGSSISSGKVRTIYEDKNKELWIGIYNGGLNRYNPETGEVTIYKHDPDDETSISNDIFSDIFEDSRGRLWISTNEGLNIYQPDSDNFKIATSDFFIDNNITKSFTRALEDSKGNFWIGTYFDGLLKTDLDLNNMKQYKISDNLIRDIIERKNGEIWVGTNKGLNRYENNSDSFTQYFLDKNQPTGINNNDIRALIEDHQNRLWIGTSGGGVMLYNDLEDTFKHFTTKDGLSNNYIMAMDITEDGHIWIGSKDGISIINASTYNIETITKEDGLDNYEFNEGILVDENDDIYMGAFDTVYKFDSTTTNIYSIPPEVYITSLKLNDVAIPDISTHSNKEKIEFDYRDARHIGIDFVGLSYLYPHKTEYSYKLDGFDKEWSIYDARSYAIYTNLSPGKYTFYVKAVNRDGIESEEIAHLTIVIKPPFWATWWAYTLYAIFSILFIYLLISLKENFQRKRRLTELQITNDTNRNLSLTDPLTKVYNRRYLRQRFESEIETAIMYGRPLSTLMMDIDNFKKYNDTHGHVQGDSCLIEVVRAIKSVLRRPDDTFARYGGEEFCLVLPGTDLDGACHIAEQIVEAVNKTGVVTISIGVFSKIPDTTDSSQKFIHKADEALYRAKKNGKNRYEFF